MPTTGRLRRRHSSRPPMESFGRLGRAVDSVWRRANYDESALPAIALDALQDLPSHMVDPIAITRSAMRSELPAQLDPHSSYGEPPLTVYADERLIIDVYFHIDGSTLTHQHAFSGAFYVASGSSLHTRSIWHLQRQINSQFALGELEHAETELLRTGDSRAIVSGPALIHSLFHVDRPSTTIVIRSRADHHNPVMFEYAKPHVAIGPVYPYPGLRRKLEILRMLDRIGHREWLGHAKSLLRSADLPSTYVILRHGLMTRLRTMSRLEPLLRLARTIHGPIIDRFVPCLGELLREHAVALVRTRVSDPELRFFLGLLLVIPRGGAIRQCVAKWTGNRRPVVAIDGWIEALTTGSSDADAPLGLRLDESARSILSYLVRGRSPREIHGLLEARHGVAEVARHRVLIDETCEALRTSVYFAPLLR